ncbi:MAG: hypothetical protein JWN07_1207, partial [Hyphomicrobiales bacterium]|nr:hypothetical protein [Hyphomicrobiales bacterium]
MIRFLVERLPHSFRGGNKTLTGWLGTLVVFLGLSLFGATAAQAQFFSITVSNTNPAVNEVVQVNVSSTYPAVFNSYLYVDGQPDIFNIIPIPANGIVSVPVSFASAGA